MLATNGPMNSDQVSSMLFELYDALGTWKAVADEIGCNKGLCWQVAMGQTKSPRIERALGLRESQVRASALMESREQRRRLYDRLGGLGLSFTELARAIADGRVEVRMVES